MLTASQQPPEWQSGKLCTNAQFGVLPKPLQNVIFKMMQLNPEERYSGFFEVLAGLKAIKVERKPAKPSKQEGVTPVEDNKKVGLPIAVGGVVLLAFGTSILLYVTGNDLRAWEYLQISAHDAITWMESLGESFLGK